MPKTVLPSLLCLAIAIPAAAGAPAAAPGLTVDEIIKKNIDAHGGLDKMKAVKSQKITGKLSMGGMEAPFTILNKRPNQTRMDITIQGQTISQAYDGTIAWGMNPMMGSKDPQKMSADETRDMEEESDIDGPLVDYKEKGHKVELVGKEDLEGAPVYKLHVTLKNGNEQNIYLDAENFLDVKMSSKRKVQGTEMETESLLGDYKEESGLMVPHAIENKANGQTMVQITVQKVELNADIDSASFAMPAAAPAAATK